ncbi:hypothetical protein CMI37_26130 [Candidatus Pacearchaeota archaeon]|nr:hypothetical protein [Candidatus Pacearchaeota archaeon]|tara:strand:+ start:9234 stop:9518 length:285 start_codon:yes stop_codon:yes gene_type:complete
MLSRENRIDITTIIIASMSTILGLIISFILPNVQILILTILTILLPVIYQIGNICSKESVRSQTKNDLNILEEAVEDLEYENNLLNEELRRKLE